MQRDEAMAAGGLLAEGLSGATARIEELHGAIAARAFGSTGDAAQPARVLHDGIATGVYAAVRVLGGLAARASGAAIAASRPADAPSISRTPRGNLAVSALNGVIGDVLEREASGLAVDMAVRVDGGDLPLEPAAVAAAFPAATGRIAVFVHGLCETDLSWRLAARRSHGVPPARREPSQSARRAGTSHHGDASITYGALLERDLGYTPVYVRYNTGLRVAENGRRLAALLDDLAAAWPVPVAEVSIVGHSMGGLVARSACHEAHGEGQDWVPVLRHVVCLGSPHLGAPLEQGAYWAARALSAVPESRPVGRILDGRSEGIKDLRRGLADVPFVDGACYCFVAATVGRTADGVLSRLLGDLLVLHSSASGARRIPFEADNGLSLSGLNHLDLLNHPAVYEKLREWLARPPRALPTASAPSSYRARALARFPSRRHRS